MIGFNGTFRDIDPKRLRELNKKMDEFLDVLDIKERPMWEEWYAWYPVKDIHGQRHWLKKVYRKYNWAKSTEQPFGKNYDYGTIFDVLNND